MQNSNNSTVSKGKYQIKTLIGRESLLQRLNDLGFIEGTEIEILGRGPLGGPYMVMVGTSLFAVRPDELNCLNLKSID